jgi:TRAP-type C4-dicarboxylate transport system permease small subunit
MSDTGKAKKGFGEWIITVYTGIGAVAMGVLAVMVIFTVICRYCFSLSWKQVSEFNVTLFAFTTFWGLGLNVLKNEHVSINILYDALPPVPKRVVHCLDLLIMLVVDCVFTKYAWDYTLKMGTQISQGMEIPMKYMYGIMPVCGAICLVCIVVKFIELLRRPVSQFGKTDAVSPLE